eukprot:scaffold1402_cov254-Pinguiococcus_pyrenoidosus.AAC.30
MARLAIPLLLCLANEVRALLPTPRLFSLSRAETRFRPAASRAAAFALPRRPFPTMADSDMPREDAPWLVRPGQLPSAAAASRRSRFQAPAARLVSASGSATSARSRGVWRGTRRERFLERRESSQRTPVLLPPP